jgi:multisubunit Na+/H+ antiporter MnhB subunit
MPETMSLLLPEYSPPNAQRSALAAGVAPILVLLSFTLIVARLIDADTGFAIFAACTVWVVYEMSVYQRTIDAYNEAYVGRHLAWRTSEALLALAAAPGTHASTRDFVARFVAAQRVLLRDGQLP